jgi:hypothetical protein
MKTLLSIFALALAFVFTGPAFTGPAFTGLPFIGSAFAGDVKDAKTEGDCIMANGEWDDKTKTCKKR